MNFKSGLMSPPPQMGQMLRSQVHQAQNPYDKMMAQQQYGAFKRGQMGAPGMLPPKEYGASAMGAMPNFNNPQMGFEVSDGGASPHSAIGAMPNSNTAPMGNAMLRKDQMRDPSTPIDPERLRMAQEFKASNTYTGNPFTQGMGQMQPMGQPNMAPQSPPVANPGGYGFAQGSGMNRQMRDMYGRNPMMRGQRGY